MKNKFIPVAGLIVGIFFCAAEPVAQGAASDVARGELRGYLENVNQATGRRYGVHDNAAHSMDCVKIIRNPSIAGQFIAVYHTYVGGVAKVNLATSTDLFNWTWIRELAGSGNGPASQPTIKAAGNAFVVAWEQEPNNHVKLVYFNNWTDLQNGQVAKSFAAPRTFSNCAEGTPSLYSASSSSCDVGFHYYSNCDVDRQARATCTWTSWSATKQPNFDNALLYHGVQGNIGDRDGYANFRGYNFGLIEGQFIKGDFGSWRTFLYDYATGNADQLTVRTDGGSLAFANPTIEFITFNGQPTVLCTMFLPSEGVRGGDAAGALIYYRHYSNAGVIFHQNSNYTGGATQPLAKGNYTLAQLQAKGFINDWASSAKVPSGWTLIMYQHDNFTGTSWTRTADTPNFSTFPGLNDQVSSCKIQ